MKKFNKILVLTFLMIIFVGCASEPEITTEPTTEITEITTVTEPTTEIAEITTVTEPTAETTETTTVTESTAETTTEAETMTEIVNYSNGEWEEKYISDTGKVLSVKAYDTKGNLLYIDENDYDENDYMIKSSCYHVDGSLLGYSIYENNDEGYPLKKIEYDPSTNEILRTSEYKYDENNRVTEDEVYDNKSILRQHVFYEYTATGGKIMKCLNYDEEGNIYDQQEWIIDENGVTLSMTSYLLDSSGKPYKYAVSELDENNRVQNYTEYDMEDNVLWIFKYIYDDEGNRQEIKIFDANSILITHEVYHYDGKCTRSDYFPGGTALERATLYNNDGSIIETTVYYETGDIRLKQTVDENKYSHLWQYDENGQLIDECIIDPDGNRIEI